MLNKKKDIDTIMIDTVPLPERVSRIEIPVSLLKEFGEEGRVLIGGGGTQGIVGSLALIKKMADPQFFQEINEKFDVLLIPKAKG